jgi:hypothetical protein
MYIPFKRLAYLNIKKYPFLLNFEQIKTVHFY